MEASAVATMYTNDYIDNYNNKPALGPSAIGPGYDLPSFVDDGYTSVTKFGNGKNGLSDNTIPCVACHHTLDRGEIFQFLEPESKLGNGIKNTAFGVVGTIGAVAAIPETAGGSGLALGLTIGQTSIGIAQIADSFNERPNPVLHNYSTVPGLIAGQRGSKYAPMIDFTSAWITGSVNSPYYFGNTIGVFRSGKAIYQGEQVLINGFSIYSTGSTGYSGYLLYKNRKK